MKDTSTRLFLRYRASRDGKALAKLLERLGPELLTVSLHLARDRASAEDLVQSTFVVALEAPEAFDPQREVKPWMYGILARQAARARRDAAKRIPDGRMRDVAAEVECHSTPLLSAESSEAADLVRGVLTALPSHYRDVLTPYLGEGLTAREIAGRLDGNRSAGHVRVQIGRGLELLRQRLPRGLEPSGVGRGAAIGAGGSAVTGAGLSGLDRGWRNRVVEQFAENAEAAMDAPAVSGSMKALLGVCAFAVAAVVVVAIGVRKPGDEPGPTQSAARRALAEVPRDQVEPSLASVSSVPKARRSNEQMQAAEVVDAQRTPPVQGADALDATAGLVLTVTDTDGVVIANAGVRLQVNRSPWDVCPRLDPDAGPILEQATGPGGRAVFTAIATGQHWVEVRADGYASRDIFSTPRLRGAEPLELGIVLNAEAVLEGTVRDGSGEPIANAKVYVDRRSGVPESERTDIAWSSADGRYRIAGLSRGRFEVKASALGAPIAVHYPRFRTGEVTQWDPVLVPTEPVRGVLVDGRGAPLQGWWVRGYDHRSGLVDPPEAAGAEPRTVPDRWRTECQTDASGRFELAGLDGDDLMIAAQEERAWAPSKPLAVFDPVARSMQPVRLRVNGTWTSERVHGAIAMRGGGELSGLRVALRDARYAAEREVTLASDGAFEFSVFRSDGASVSLELVVRIDYAMEIEQREYALTGETQPGQGWDVGVWDVEAPGELVVETVPDEHGDRLRGMWLLQPVGDVADRTRGTMFEEGAAGPQRVLPGSYELTLLSSPTHRTAGTPLTVEPGRRTTVRPDVESALGCEVRFEDPEGNAIASPVRLEVVQMATDLVLVDQRVPSGEAARITVEPVGQVLLQATSDDGRVGRLIDTRGTGDGAALRIVLQ